MSVLVAISITTAILSAVWGWVAVSFGLFAWAGFLGCTSFFAAPFDGIKGLLISLITNISGVFWAMMIIEGGSFIDMDVLAYGLTGLITLFMCLQAKNSWLAFIPGTFIGSCATFAADGNWQIVVPSLVLGGIFGYVMKSTGLWLHSKCEQTEGSTSAAAQSRH